MTTAASEPGALALIALPTAKLLLHPAVGRGYGYHRDELYDLARANHLAWGYVDRPPFAVLVLAATRALLGDSVAAIRVVRAVIGVLDVQLVGVIARRSEVLRPGPGDDGGSDRRRSTSRSTPTSP